jgi:hypothetical protein
MFVFHSFHVPNNAFCCFCSGHRYSCAFVSMFICTFTCTFFNSNWLSLAWWVVAVSSKPPTTPPARVSGRGLPMEESCRGPQPVRGVYLVATGSPQCGHLGRSSGLQDTDFNDGSSDDDFVSSYSDRWVPGSGMPGSFCLVLGPLAPVVPVEGGPRAAAVFAMVFLLILEPSSSADFGHRSKRPAGSRSHAAVGSSSCAACGRGGH